MKFFINSLLVLTCITTSLSYALPKLPTLKQGIMRQLRLFNALQQQHHAYTKFQHAETTEKNIIQAATTTEPIYADMSLTNKLRFKDLSLLASATERAQALNDSERLRSTLIFRSAQTANRATLEAEKEYKKACKEVKLVKASCKKITLNTCNCDTDKAESSGIADAQY